MSRYRYRTSWPVRTAGICTPGRANALHGSSPPRYHFACHISRGLHIASGSRRTRARCCSSPASRRLQNAKHDCRDTTSHNEEPGLDLLLEAPDGTLAAFCYCAIPGEANELSGRGEGEIAIIGTRPAYQKQGIGRAMLLAGLQRLKDFGVETATLGTSSENTGAQSVFISAGFRMSYRSLWYSKSIR